MQTWTSLIHHARLFGQAILLSCPIGHAKKRARITTEKIAFCSLLPMRMTLLPVLVQKIMSSLITKLHRIANKIFRWLENNHVKPNPGKSHVPLSSNTQRVVLFDNVQITLSLKEKLLGITFDTELKFEKRISKI